jgi:hypothetical protein
MIIGVVDELVRPSQVLELRGENSAPTQSIGEQLRLVRVPNVDDGGWRILHWSTKSLTRLLEAVLPLTQCCTALLNVLDL